MASVLKIDVQNANGLTQRTKELKYFLYEQNIDVMLISETHFTKKSYLNILHYNAYDTQHPDESAHGGSALIVKSTIKHHVNENFSEVPSGNEYNNRRLDRTNYPGSNIQSTQAYNKTETIHQFFSKPLEPDLLQVEITTQNICGVPDPIYPPLKADNSISQCQNITSIQFPQENQRIGPQTVGKFLTSQTFV